MNKENKYSFDSINHIHTLDGKPLIGCTTALSVISKPALIQWSANMAVSFIDDEITSMFAEDDKMTGEKAWKELEEFWPSIMREAKTAYRKKRDKAGDWGTAVHLAVEVWIKEKKEPRDLDEKGLEVFTKFKEWVKENKVEFIESEKHIYSKDLWVGGIMDLVLTIDGKKYIGDIKTSSGIYDEAFFQMGGYDLMLEEMGQHQDTEGYIVINLKKDGTIDFKIATDKELNRQAFKSALALYKIIQSLKK